jgi:hypothetical protein
MPDRGLDQELFSGLRQLTDSAFPKRCANCGREYRNAAEFLAATQRTGAQSSGLKQSKDDDGSTIVDLFRNCVCGSTLLESFWNRRDLSEEGMLRRKRFEEMIGKLVAIGYDAKFARSELLKFMHGQPNDVVDLVRQAAAKDGFGST